MSKKMLIDATHAEETRVVVVDGNKVEEFDFESENKRQLAGNIYLAKVTRVEPSLQAAFVDYGGNRHGFLAFSEIHPHYYQIPVADQEALLAEEKAYAEAQRDAEEQEDKPKQPKRRRRGGRSKAAAAQNDDMVATSEPTVEEGVSGMETIDLGSDDGAPLDLDEGQSGEEAPVEAQAEAPEEAPAPEAAGAAPEVEDVAEAPAAEESASSDAGDDAEGDSDAEASDETTEDDTTEDDTTDNGIESVAEEDDSEEVRPVRKPRPRRYKIQEVIKVRQILLVQVVKEERGNKGAALTTYLSLAGRYCVLMPNTARGGGISRKITNAADRKKLKEIAHEIEVPEGVGLIVRTAGAKRTKSEIKRDYEYLQRLWEQIRELTLKSIAPAKIYEEGNLIKRSIRDLYNRDIEEVLVEGAEGHRSAKDFMKMIMPSHAKNVKLYEDPLPLFARFQVESYLAGMFNPTVQLKSGGYIVIGITEALVAVDVNSGRATKEGSIEETALKTNLEAAEEVARQVRLRDLAGLIVIDFIDMDERKNNAAVEKRIKDKLKTDRARIQVGRISGFGLMEMSRQRLRPGMLEATTQPCPSCHGTGLIRSDDSMGLSILRHLEEEGVRGRSKEVLITAPVQIANFLMNQKREHIAHIEARYGLSIRVEGDPHLVSPDFTMEKFKTATRVVKKASAAVVSVDAAMMEELDAEIEAEEAEAASNVPSDEGEDTQAQPKKRRRRRRRRRGGGSDADGQQQGQSDNQSENPSENDGKASTDAPAETLTESADGDTQNDASADPVAEEAPKPKRRRSRKKPVAEDGADSEAQTAEVDGKAESAADPEGEAEEPKPKRKRAPRKRKADAVSEAVPEANAEAPSQETEAPQAEEKPKRKRAPRKKAAAAAEAPTESASEGPAETPVLEVASAESSAETTTAPASTEEEVTPKPRRKGWWNLNRS
ncbi:MAG: Rne/Rng family ribonuclease [Pseudomonadota bacterium]